MWRRILSLATTVTALNNSSIWSWQGRLLLTVSTAKKSSMTIKSEGLWIVLNLDFWLSFKLWGTSKWVSIWKTLYSQSGSSAKNFTITSSLGTATSLPRTTKLKSLILSTSMDYTTVEIGSDWRCPLWLKNRWRVWSPKSCLWLSRWWWPNGVQSVQTGTAARRFFDCQVIIINYASKSFELLLLQQNPFLFEVVAADPSDF